MDTPKPEENVAPEVATPATPPAVEAATPPAEGAPGSEPVPPKVQGHLDAVPHANNPIEPHHTNHFFRIILILLVVILLVVGAGVAWMYMQGQNAQKAAEEAQKTAVVPTATPAIAPDPTADWKVYTSACGFTIKYPEDHNLEDAPATCVARHQGNGSIVSSDNGQTFYLNIAVDPKPKTTNFEDELKAYYPTSKDNQIPTTVAGFQAIKFKVSENEQAGKNGNGISTGVIILADGKFYQFNLIGVPESEEVFDQMLTTFKIVEQPTVSPAASGSASTTTP